MSDWWVCEVCHSINRPASSICYSCKKPAGFRPQAQPPSAPAAAGTQAPATSDPRTPEPPRFDAPQTPPAQAASVLPQPPQYGQGQPPQYGQAAYGQPQYGQPQYGQAQWPPSPPQGFGYAAPSAQTAPPQVASYPAGCPRCQAPVYPGYPQCTNCGLDLLWNAPVQVLPARRSKLPILAAVLLVAAFAVGGAFIVASRLGSTPASSNGGNGSADSTWITFTPSTGGFSAKYPAEPKQTSQTIKTAVGDAAISLWTYVQSADLAFFAGVGNYPKGSMQGVNPSAIYDGAVAGMASSTSLQVDSQQGVTLDGHAGRSFSLKGGQYLVKGQLYVVGDDLYMVYAVYDPGLRDTDARDAFLADFHLTI